MCLHAHMCPVMALALHSLFLLASAAWTCLLHVARHLKSTSIANMSSPSDQHLLHGHSPSSSRTKQLEQEIDNAVNQMRSNITKVGERGERLDALQDKTDNLATQANGFRRGANRVRKQMWWKDMKMRMCIIVGIIILLVVIIVPSGEHRTERTRRLQAS